MTIKLSEVNNDSGEGKATNLPEGRYNFKLDSAELTESPNKGTPQISIRAKVLGGKFSGKTRFINLYLTPAALWKLQAFLMAWDYDKAREDIEEKALVEDLNKIQPTFSAWVDNKDGRNEFNEFTAVSELASDDTEDDDFPF